MSSAEEDLSEVDYSQLRKHKRYAITALCEVSDLKSQKTVKSCLTTISVGGLSFIYPEILEQGSKYLIKFKMPNGSSVEKSIEIRWFEKDLIKKTVDLAEIQGFEHGCKFIIIKDDGTTHDEKSIDDVPEKPAETEKIKLEKPISQPQALQRDEAFISCMYHMEYFRVNSQLMRHGYIYKIGEEHLFFYTMTDITKGEILACNLIINEGDYREERISIDVLEISKQGKQFSVKGKKI